MKNPTQQPDNQQNDGDDKQYMEKPAQTGDNQEAQQPQGQKYKADNQ